MRQNGGPDWSRKLGAYMWGIPDEVIDVAEGLVADALGGDVSVVGASELGASSRETPWRLDVTRSGQPESYLLRYGESVEEGEAIALLAMAGHPIPSPSLIAWQPVGPHDGIAVFISEFIRGSSLLPPMRAGERWAIDLYVETVCDLQAIQRHDLSSEFASLLDERRESAIDVIEAARSRIPNLSSLHEAASRKLVRTQPELPVLAFSNGDLWPDNLLIDDRTLVGVIDWQHAGWSDPIFEFLLPFFLVPELRGRGIEEEYMDRQGYDTGILHWYRGVEFFDSLAWVIAMGEPYEIHTVESLTADLTEWLDQA